RKREEWRSRAGLSGTCWKVRHLRSGSGTDRGVRIIRYLADQPQPLERTSGHSVRKSQLPPGPLAGESATRRIGYKVDSVTCDTYPLRALPAVARPVKLGPGLRPLENHHDEPPIPHPHRPPRIPLPPVRLSGTAGPGQQGASRRAAPE